MNDNLKNILAEFGLNDEINVNEFVDSFTREMTDGLEGKRSSLAMFPSFLVDNFTESKETILTIDMGGTNFRTALVSFEGGKWKIETKQDNGCKMPGIESELSLKEFFAKIKEEIDKYDKNDYSKIGFCFSYPTKMNPKQGRVIDGTLEKWTKGIQVPELVGKQVGITFLEEMGLQDKPLVILNDTVTTLLAGKGQYPDYGAYIGLILGTGTNMCYLEKGANIAKIEGGSSKDQIINMESGNFYKFVRSELDIELDNIENKHLDEKLRDIDSQAFEKLISGRYLGNLCELIIKKLAKKSYFSSATNLIINEIEEPFKNVLNVNDLEKLKDEDLQQKYLEQLTKTEVASFFIADVISLPHLFATEDDVKAVKDIINIIIERAAKYIAASIAAVILKTGKGITENDKVLIVVDDSTYYKFKGFKESIKKNLDYCFNELAEKRFYDILNKKEQIISDINLKGAAIAVIGNV